MNIEKVNLPDKIGKPLDLKLKENKRFYGESKHEEVKVTKFFYNKETNQYITNLPMYNREKLLEQYKNWNSKSLYTGVRLHKRFIEFEFTYDMNFKNHRASIHYSVEKLEEFIESYKELLTNEKFVNLVSEAYLTLIKSLVNDSDDWVYLEETQNVTEYRYNVDPYYRAGGGSYIQD